MLNFIKTRGFFATTKEVRAKWALPVNATLSQRIAPTNSLFKKFFDIGNQYFRSRNAVDHELERIVNQGIQFRQNHDFEMAFPTLNEAILLFSNQEIANLTNRQRDLLSKAYTNLADMLRMGSTKDEDQAMQYIEKALILNPLNEKSIHLKKSLLADHNISDTSVCYSR